MITSRNNPKIKQTRALRKRKERKNTGFFLVEGIRHVGEAVEAGVEIEAIYYAPAFLNSEFAQGLIEKQSAKGVSCCAVASDVFNAITERENPQGILAVVHKHTETLDEISPRNFDWGVALLAPQDSGNVGAILRTIDAVEACGLLLLDSSVDPTHPTAVRASMGAIFWHPVLTVVFEDFAAWARQHGYHVYGTSVHGSVDYAHVHAYERPLILLMGSEREGLTPDQTALCDVMVRLPMRGRGTSLNLAVATGVMLYEIFGKIVDRDTIT